MRTLTRHPLRRHHRFPQGSSPSHHPPLILNTCRVVRSRQRRYHYRRLASSVLLLPVVLGWGPVSVINELHPLEDGWTSAGSDDSPRPFGKEYVSICQQYSRPHCSLSKATCLSQASQGSEPCHPISGRFVCQRSISLSLQPAVSVLTLSSEIRHANRLAVPHSPCLIRSQ